MPRGNRLRGEGGVYHVTHRCHDRSFLLKFARDRDPYRSLLREHLGCFDLSLLDYCLTSDHVHVLLDAPEWQEISGFIREVAGGVCPVDRQVFTGACSTKGVFAGSASLRSNTPFIVKPHGHHLTSTL